MTNTIGQAPDDIPVDDRSAPAIRAFSKALFGGGRYRAEIGAAIHEKGIVNTSELADQLDLPKQTVNQELRLLERIGLLMRDETNDSSRKVFLRRQDSIYWAFCAEAALEAAVRLRDVRQF
jgi:predicted transcriptional regulator